MTLGGSKRIVGVSLPRIVGPVLRPMQVENINMRDDGGPSERKTRV